MRCDTLQVQIPNGAVSRHAAGKAKSEFDRNPLFRLARRRTAMEELTASVVRQAESGEVGALQATLSKLVQRLLLEPDSLVEVTNYVAASVFPALGNSESTALVEETLIDAIWQADQDIEQGFLQFAFPNLDPPALKLANVQAMQRVEQFLKSLTVRLSPRAAVDTATYSPLPPSRSSSSPRRPASNDSSPVPPSPPDYSASTSPRLIVKSFKPKPDYCAHSIALRTLHHGVLMHYIPTATSSRNSTSCEKNRKDTRNLREKLWPTWANRTLPRTRDRSKRSSNACIARS